MASFGRPNIAKMVNDNDREGLYSCLEHRDSIVRLQAAQALAELGDGAGWRVLSDWVRDDQDPNVQDTAAAILGELGARSPGDAHRVIPALGDALKQARGDTAAVIRDALISVGGPEAEEALRQAGYTPTPVETTGEVSDFDAHFIRPILMETGEIEFLSAETHLNTAVDLREAELAERGLVECTLALWLKPNWDYAWYLRGVLFEDLDRPFEAWLAYQRALQIEPHHDDAREALDELEQDHPDLPILENDALMKSIGSPRWQERRDAAAGLAELARKDPDRLNDISTALLGLLEDEEREVRHAAIHAIGSLGDQAALPGLINLPETSWLLRFAIVEALARLQSVDALVTVLQREMDRLMDRNPTFSHLRDPLIEVEYSLIFEIGVLALEHTGDLESLLAIAEGNSWEEIDVEFEEDEEEVVEQDPAQIANLIDGMDTDEDEEFDDVEADEDLSSYVDEVSHMACLALDRLARPSLASLDNALLERISSVPDLTLVDIELWDSTEEEDPTSSEFEDEEVPTALVCDLSGLREAARAEQARRGGGLS